MIAQVKHITGNSSNEFLLKIVLLFILIFTVSTSSSSEQPSKNDFPTSIKQQLLTGQFQRASKQLEVLSNQGNAEAQYHLAILNLNGRGVKRSATKAEKLLIQSAPHFTDSAFLLGSLYLKGKQLKSDRFAAIKYLRIAASSGNIKANNLLDKLDNKQRNKSITTKERQEKIIIAISNNNLSDVKRLIDEGLNINQIDSIGRTPLLIAINNQSTEIATWLIRQTETKFNLSDDHGNTALHYAADSNQLKLLINIASKTKNLEPLNKYKQTPLIVATLNGKLQSAQWLVSKKSDYQRKDLFGKSARDYAKEKNITLKFNANSVDKKAHLQLLSNQQRQHQMKALKTEQKTMTSLHYQWPILLIAVAQKQQELSKWILGSGSDPWQTNPIGETALALALETKQPLLLDKMLHMHPINSSRDSTSINALFALAIHTNNAQLVKKLLIYIGRDGVYKNRNYSILEAIKANSAEVVEYLSSQTIRKPTGYMLHLAISSNYNEVATILVEQGAPVNWKDSKGRNALWIAADSTNDDILTILIQAKATINDSDNNGQTPLMRATVKNCIHCAKILMNHGANPEKASATGNTSVMYAAQYSDPILRLFTDNDLDLSMRNNQTLTPLMLAIKNNNLMCVQTLLKAGANPKRRNEMGQNAYDMALKLPNILKLLEKY